VRNPDKPHWGRTVLSGSGYSKHYGFWLLGLWFGVIIWRDW
jgi:hypothetical protein